MADLPEAVTVTLHHVMLGYDEVARYTPVPDTFPQRWECIITRVKTGDPIPSNPDYAPDGRVLNPRLQVHMPDFAALWTSPADAGNVPAFPPMAKPVHTLPDLDGSVNPPGS